MRSLAIVLCLARPLLTYAQQPDTGRATENLGAAEQELAASQQHSAELEKDVAALLAEQEELSARLITAADEVSLREQALNDTGTRITALDDEALAIRTELAAKRETLSELLAGLQRLEQNPPPALVVAPNRILDALRGAMMFGAVVPEMRAEAEHLLDRLTRLEAIKTETAQARIAAEGQLDALRRARDDVAALVESRKAVLGKSQQALKNEQKRQRELTARASNLRQLLAVLADADAKKTANEKARAEELARQREELARPHVALAQAKGRLDYPVQGRILARFGEANGLGSAMAGLAIAAQPSALVRSPADMTVSFAGPFRSFGQLLILDAGENYLMLFAGLKKLDVSLGQQVRAGEPLGQLGEKPVISAFYSTGVPLNRPVLYVELRKNGEPVDSNPWWTGGTVEARAAGKSE